jgi:hypothetical protein
LDLARIASLVIKERYGRKQKWVIIDWFFEKSKYSDSEERQNGRRRWWNLFTVSFILKIWFLLGVAMNRTNSNKV